MAGPHGAHGVGIEGGEITSEEARGTSEAITAHTAGEPERQDYSSNIEGVGTKPVQAKTLEPKPPESKAKNSKSLPFNPAKVKATTTKSKRDKGVGVSIAGKKPTGIRKLRSTRPPKRSEKGSTPSLDDMLSEARRWIAPPTSYMIRNTETGCFGLSVRKPEADRSEITIAHAVDCGCLDVRLMHIARHVDGLVKARHHLARRSRDAFVIATKIRSKLPHPIPKAARFRYLGEKQVGRRPRTEVEAETAIINVVDVHRQQKLIEKWKSLEAYQKRPIWKDW
ncbi:hypothetical protein F4860DRAFT_254508 [Xylaria cubensis]|nr:hypothetical protein F4860DRAFT_254508 [Xylaria cubensis]